MWGKNTILEFIEKDKHPFLLENSNEHSYPVSSATFFLWIPGKKTTPFSLKTRMSMATQWVQWCHYWRCCIYWAILPYQNWQAIIGGAWRWCCGFIVYTCCVIDRLPTSTTNYIYMLYTLTVISHIYAEVTYDIMDLFINGPPRLGHWFEKEICRCFLHESHANRRYFYNDHYSLRDLRGNTE